MKLTVALALLACTHGVKVNDKSPHEKMHIQDTTQLDDLTTVHIETDTKAETEADEDADIDEEADADMDEADIDDDELVSELDAGDLHEIMEDPVDMFEALQSSTEADVDEVDQKQNEAIVNEYKKELGEINGFFKTMQAAMESAKKDQTNTLKKEYQNKYNRSRGKHKFRNKYWAKKCGCYKKCVSDESPFGKAVDQCLRKCVKGCKKRKEHLKKKRAQKKAAKNDKAKDTTKEEKSKPKNNKKRGGRKQKGNNTSATNSSKSAPKKTKAIEVESAPAVEKLASSKLQQKMEAEMDQQIKQQILHKRRSADTPQSEQMMEDFAKKMQAFAQGQHEE